MLCMLVRYRWVPAFSTSARGVEVVGWNPSYLAFRDNPAFSFTTPIGNMNFRLVNDFFSLQLLGDTFEEGKYLNEDDKQEIIDLLEGDDWELYEDFYLPLLGVSFNTDYVSMAITADVGQTMDFYISDEILELAFQGYGFNNQGELKDFTTDGGRAYGGARLGWTVARQFDVAPDGLINELVAGATFSYNLGFFFFDVLRSEGSYRADDQVLEGYGLIEIVNADTADLGSIKGNGVGLDLGIGAKMLNNRLTVGLGFINIVNEMTWNEVDRRVYSYQVDNAPPLNLTDPEEWFDENFTLVDSLVEDNVQYTTNMPSYLNIAVGYRATRSILLSGTWRHGLNETIGNNGKPRIGAGIEFRGIPFLPLRAGVAAGGRGKLALGAGFGLYFGPWRTDIGFAFEEGFMTDTKGMQFGINTTFMFGFPDEEEFRRLPPSASERNRPSSRGTRRPPNR